MKSILPAGAFLKQITQEAVYEQALIATGCRKNSGHETILTRRLIGLLRHAGFDPASSVFLVSRLRGNDGQKIDLDKIFLS